MYHSYTRTIMTFGDEFLDLMPHHVLVEPWASQDGYGAPTFGAAVEYQCLVQQGVKMIRDISGQERVSMTQIYLATTDAIDPRSRLTLPAGYVPLKPPILAITRFSDETGVCATVVYA